MTKAKLAEVPKEEKPTGLALLREPFLDHQISKLPKPTKRQTDEVRADFKKGIRCKVCGGWHHPDVIHLDYVGHAALTDRLLDCDLEWNWTPVATNDDGTPKFDENGGMWISLTVCGVTRLGYGHPDGKRGGDAFKETIGDALRNAAMRFGAALDLWHKGDLHGHTSENEEVKAQKEPQGPAQEAVAAAVDSLTNADSLDRLRAIWGDLPKAIHAVPAVVTAKNARKAKLEAAESKPEPVEIDDEIPFG